MDFLHREIVRLLNENGQMSAGKIMNKLNGLGMDISLDYVERELH